MPEKISVIAIPDAEGKLLAIVHHDIKNHCTKILGCIEYGQDDIKELLEKIIANNQPKQ